MYLINSIVQIDFEFEFQIKLEIELNLVIKHNQFNESVKWNKWKTLNIKFEHYIYL
jgi:hypothetical protein